MRQFHISSGAFVMDTLPIEVDPFPMTFPISPNGEKARLALGMFNGKETIFAVWSNANDLHDSSHTCVGGGDDTHNGASQTIPAVQWFVGLSIDNAHSWKVSQLPGTDNAWPSCVGPGRSAPVNSLEAAFGQNRNLPIPVLDTLDGEFFVAINRSGDNKDLSQGTRGTRLKLFGATSPTLATWNDIPLPVVKVTTLQDHWGQWLSVTTAPGETHARLGLTWFSTSDSPGANNREITVRGTFSIPGASTFPTFPPDSIAVASGTGVPWTLTDKWGDYNGGAGSPFDGNFLSAWTDNRDETKANIWGRSVTP
jgi:hypothetical protein